MNYADLPEIRTLVKTALKEDIGKGDITTRLTVPKGIKAKAVITAGEKGVICGQAVAGMVFKSVDKRIRYLPCLKDGAEIKKGDVLARISGPARGVLTAERVALNFLGFLSGIATRTREFLLRTQRYPVKILDTRKTIPGLRLLEKYAVKTAGAANHRLCLDEMVLIKDNHLALRKQAARFNKKDMLCLIRDLRKALPGKVKIEMEAANLKEFKNALSACPDIIMLDNMACKDLRRALRLKNSFLGKRTRSLPRLEASGNITLKNISAYAACGVDFISLGTLTKDVRSLDISLELKGIYRQSANRRTK